MPIELIPARPEHLHDLARICHLAFNTLHERHAIHRDIPDEDVGRLIMGAVLNRSDYTGAVAVDRTRIIGSNFLMHADPICGLGPITVDPTAQSKGAGRLLMQWAIDEARRRGRDSVRLFQEAVNTTSLSLYTSVGFSWRYSAALMMPAPADADDPDTRPMTRDDLPAVDRLSTQYHGHTRVNDAAQLLAMNLPAFVRERRGNIVGYQIASLFGHAAAESPDDLLALASHTARHAPPPMSVVIVPLHQPELFLATLARSFRVLKTLNHMALGDFTLPRGPCFPSIQC